MRNRQTLRVTLPIAAVGALVIVGLLGAFTAAEGTASPVVVAQADPPPPTCVECPKGYHCVHNPEGCEKDNPSKASLDRPAPTYSRVAQNANYVACYKDVDFKKIRFRWCPKDKPWTATNETRNFCYETSEDCARAEMPQSWCIKCEGEQ